MKEFETKKVRMGLGEFTACARKWGTRNVLLKATVQEAAVGQAAEVRSTCIHFSISSAMPVTHASSLGFSYNIHLVDLATASF